MTEQSIEEHKVRSEEGFIINIDENIGPDGSTTLHFENPPGDGVRAIVTKIKVNSPDGKVIVEQPYGFTIDSLGTEHPIENRARGSSVESAMNAYKDTTYSGASHVDRSYIGSGTGGAGNIGGAISQDISNTVLSDSDMIITMQNASSSNSRDVSLTMTYYESTFGDD